MKHYDAFFIVFSFWWGSSFLYFSLFSFNPTIELFICLYQNKPLLLLPEAQKASLLVCLGVFLKKRTGNEKGISWITVVFHKWGWKVAKLAFIHMKTLQVITSNNLLSWATRKHVPLTHTTGGHMGPFKIWCSTCDIKVYGYVGVFVEGLWNVLYLFALGHLFKGDKSSGMCIWALVKSAHVPVLHPGHISNACSALLCCWNMKYAWTIKSIWTIYLNIRYTRPSKKIIKPNTHRLPRTHANTQNGT